MTSLLITATASPTGDVRTVGGFLAFAWQTLVEGGWLMIPLFLLALLIYFEAMSIMLRLGRAKLKKTPRSLWSTWLDRPADGHGHVGDVIRFVVGRGECNDESLLRLEAVRAKLIPDVNSRIVVLSVLVTLAPLMGLLGTVIGMLMTFRGLATSSGQAVNLVAEGIRVALITTQTGLMIAIPGYIFISMVVRSRNQYLAFLAELETMVVQRLHKQGGAQ
jgi:biopolymer transport protein ExbB